MLKSVDESLLRGILDAHSKTPIEFLYLELGAVPIRWIIQQRRNNYLKNILDRPENELIRKIYNVQKSNPYKGDFVNIVTNGIEVLCITKSEKEIRHTSKLQFRKIILKSVDKVAKN